MTDLHSLEKIELIWRLKASQKALASDVREEKRLLHDLQVHQIELELQNRNLRESQQELEMARDRYADLYDFAPVGYLTLQRGIVTESNLTVSSMLGVPRQELIGRPLSVYISNESKADFYAFLKRLLTGDGSNIVTEFVLQCRDADAKHVRLVSTCGTPGQSEPVCRTVMVDITEPRKLAAQLQLANNALESTPEGIMVTDCEHHIIMVNPAFTAITGYPKSEAIGQKMDMLKSGLQDTTFYESLWRQLQSEGKWEGEIWNRRKNGEIYPEWLILSEIRNPSGQLTHYVGIFSDITSQAQVRERLHQLAYYDPLTNLPNRELLQDKFETLMPLARRHHYAVAMLFLDLDHFKQVNDTLGHMAGDELLQETSKRLRDCVRESDIVARLGGDEFVVLLTDLKHEEEIETVAGKIISTFEAAFILHETEFYVTASIGISIFPKDGEEISTLIKNADAAMYSAKESGRNNFQFFRASLNDTSRERVLLSSHLHRTIENHQLMINYQPQISINNGQVEGIEALARWSHPVFGAVSPEKFIAVAEETGYILTLSEWITEQALTQWKEFFRDLLPDLVPRLSVNISSVQFRQQNLYAWIMGLLDKYAIEPQHLELELTESILIQDTDKASRVLNDLDRKGVSIAIDDFGTGYSSLSYLSKFPIHKVKIDHTFIKNITWDARQLRLVRTIIRMGRDMDFEVVAEGVETSSQLALLEEVGCDLIQGFVYSRPKTANDLAEWLRLRNRNSHVS